MLLEKVPKRNTWQSVYRHCEYCQMEQKVSWIQVCLYSFKWSTNLCSLREPSQNKGDKRAQPSVFHSSNPGSATYVLSLYFIFSPQREPQLILKLISYIHYRISTRYMVRALGTAPNIHYALDKSCCYH